MNFEEYLDLLIKKDASAVILRSGKPPVFRQYGSFDRTEDQPFPPEALVALIEKYAPSHTSKILETEGTARFVWQQGTGRRFRFHIWSSAHGLEVCINPLHDIFFSFEQLGLPKPSLLPILEAKHGLIVVAGSVRSGRSSTVAAIVNWFNEHRETFIATLEDPIEQWHVDKHSLVSQRELHAHFPTMAAGIHAALRQGAEVIVAGSLNRAEAIEAAVDAAHLGRLVIAVCLEKDVTGAIKRMVESLPAERRESLRLKISQSLLAAIGQTLLPRASGRGRVAAYEILVNSPAVAATIREGKLDRLLPIIQTSAKLGMISLDDYLLMLYRKGTISADACRDHAINPFEMHRNMFGEGLVGREPPDDPDEGPPVPALA